MLLPEFGQQGPAKDVRVCDACSHTPSMYSCVRTQRRAFQGALLATTSGFIESLRALGSPRGRASTCIAEAPGFHTPGAARSPQSPNMRYSVSMTHLFASLHEDDAQVQTRNLRLLALKPKPCDLQRTLCTLHPALHLHRAPYTSTPHPETPHLLPGAPEKVRDILLVPGVAPARARGAQGADPLGR